MTIDTEPGIYQTITRLTEDGDVEIIEHERVDAPCHDCDRDTLNWIGDAWVGLPWAEEPPLDPDDGAEYYMVTADVWSAAIGSEDVHYLCIGCLEARIGRILTPVDFTDAPCNEGRAGDTLRLAHRKLDTVRTPC